MTRPYARAAALAALLGTAACVDRPDLFEPGRGGGTVLRLPPGELAFYESDTLRVALLGEPAAGLRVQLLLLDSARTVLWRSALVPVRGGAGEVPVEGIPKGVERGAALLLTGLLADDEGRRAYASDDSAAAPTLADAATREARVYAGRRVRSGDGSAPGDLAAAPERGWALFPVPGQSAVGVLDLSGGGRVLGTFAAGVRPERVAYRAGVVAALGAGGGEVSFLRAGPDGLSASRSTLLPALELELDTTFLGAVRPTGRALALGCADAGCAEVFAAVPSGVQVVEGKVALPGSGGVLRIVGTPDAGRETGAFPALVLPGYTGVVRGDTSAAAEVFAPAAPSGGRERLQRRDAASVCLATALGGSPLAAGSDGVVFAAAGGDGAGPPCGPGTAILRIEGAATGTPEVSALAVRNTLAEERLGAVLDLQLSDDGDALLVLAEGEVAVLDPFLRVRGTVAVPAARSVAWLRGGGTARFAVADPAGVTVYDAARLTPVARVAIGPTAGPMVYLHRAGGADVIAAAVPGGFVVAPVPTP